MKYKCRRCKAETDIILDKEKICLKCLGKIRMHQENIEESKEVKFKEFLEKHGNKQIGCANHTQCSKKATIKEAHEQQWFLRGKAFICPECAPKMNIR